MTIVDNKHFGILFVLFVLSGNIKHFGMGALKKLMHFSKKLVKFNVLEITFVFIHSYSQCEELVSLLLNTVVLSVPLSGTSQENLINFAHGQYFYSLFSETINQQLLKNLDVTIVQLMESSVSNPQMVLDYFFKRTKSNGNVRSNTFSVVVTECIVGKKCI